MLHPMTPPTQVVTLAEVDAAINSGLLRSPYVELVSGGKNVEASDFTVARRVGGRALSGYVDASEVVQRISSGATLLMRNVEHWHHGASALARQLGAELDRPVEAFLFLTPPGQQGLGTHRDDADVFVIQIHGSKQWRIHEVPQNGEWGAGYTPDPGPEVLQTTVHPEEVLYIPRGAPHSAVGRSSGLSVHLSLTVRQPGTEELRRALTQRLDHELRLPARPVDENGLRRTATELLEHYRRRLDELTPDQLCADVECASPAQQSAPPAPESSVTVLASEPSSAADDGE
ncbi:JmjC domain-containing protein [Streptomyces avermitilis]